MSKTFFSIIRRNFLDPAIVLATRDRDINEAIQFGQPFEIVAPQSQGLRK
jgi:hypothetical protein